MATTVCFISEKGGVGKTTSCFEIAISLSQFHNMKVLIVDADYQKGGITGRLRPDLLSTMNKGSMDGVTLFHKFQELYSADDRDEMLTTLETKFGGISLVPTDPRLAGVSVHKLPSTQNIMSNNLMLLRHLQVIQKSLVLHQDTFDVILIDSHPEVSQLMNSIIYAANFAISPVKLDLQSAIGVPPVLAAIKQVNTDVEMLKRSLDEKIEYNPTLFAGAIGMMAREWGGDLKESEQIERRRLQRIGHFFDSYITEGDGIRQAALNRTSVRYVAGANAEKQADQIRQITIEFIDRCSLI